MPSFLRSDALFKAMRVRAWTLIPLVDAWRGAHAAMASGAERHERMADHAWWKGEGPTALEHWREVERDQPDRPDLPVKIAKVVREQGEIEEAERILLNARDRGLKSDELDVALQRYQRLWGRSNSAIAEAEAAVANPDTAPDMVFFSAFYLLANNRLAEAR